MVAKKEQVYHLLLRGESDSFRSQVIAIKVRILVEERIKLILYPVHDMSKSILVF